MNVIYCHLVLWIVFNLTPMMGTCNQNPAITTRITYAVSPKTTQQLRDFGQRMRVAATDTTWLRDFFVCTEYQPDRSVSYLNGNNDEGDWLLKAAIYTDVAAEVGWWQENDTAYQFRKGTVMLPGDYLISYPYGKSEDIHSDWTPIPEAEKSILGYRCLKATRTAYRYSHAADTMEGIEIIAWYSPELPYPYGPGQYGGLPGVILEVSGERTVFTAVDVSEVSGVEIPELPNATRIHPKDYRIESVRAYREFMDRIKADSGKN